jgi:CopG family nickel-responsive transcriptional regulator
VLAATHVHLDHHNCLEVAIMKDRSAELGQTADQILGVRGVNYEKFVITNTGKGITQTGIQFPADERRDED